MSTLGMTRLRRRFALRAPNSRATKIPTTRLLTTIHIFMASGIIEVTGIMVPVIGGITAMSKRRHIMTAASQRAIRKHSATKTTRRSSRTCQRVNVAEKSFGSRHSMWRTDQLTRSVSEGVCLWGYDLILRRTEVGDLPVVEWLPLAVCIG